MICTTQFLPTRLSNFNFCNSCRRFFVHSAVYYDLARNMKRILHQNLSRKFNLVARAAFSSAHFQNAGGALNLERELILYGSKKQTPVSLKSLLETGKGALLKDFEGKPRETTTASELVLFQVACFLHRELPVRIAHRVEHLQSTPFLLNSRKL